MKLFDAVLRREGKAVQEDRASELVDYDVYILSRKEWILHCSVAAAVILTITSLFYHSLIFSILLCPLALLYPKIKTRSIIKKRKAMLNLQFKDMLYSLSSSLSAGRSIESAFSEALKDLSINYTERDTYIIHEVEIILRRLEMNETVEALLNDFANRSHLEDVRNFADVFQICKRAGGNIVEVIRNTSGIISDKIEIKQNIDTMLASVRFERKALNLMPVAMILLLSVSAADYVRPIFTTLAGRAAMTVSLLLLAAAWFISERIMDIKV